jgi:hypothetical protein
MFSLLVILAAFVIITICIENDHSFLGTLGLVATAVGLSYLFKWHMLSFIIANPWLIIGGFAGYLVVGVGWMLFKWYLFVLKQKNRYKEAKDKFLREKKATELTPDLKSDWISKSYNYGFEFNPEVSRHKSEIIAWITFWPFSASWFLIHDPITRATRFLYENLKDNLQKISDHVFGDVKSDYIR